MTIDKIGNVAEENPADKAVQNTKPVEKPQEVSNKWKDKTTGEKYFAVGRFAVGKAWIMAFTAAIAMAADTTYARDKYFGIPNFIKPLQNLANKIVTPLTKQGGNVAVVGGALGSSIVLFWGGAVFAPVMKWMENGKETIVTALNKRFGKEGEVEKGIERTKDEPKQTWGDVLKGRFAAWAIVFTSFTAIALTLGRKQGNIQLDASVGQLHFDRYEQGFGRLVGNAANWIKGSSERLPKISQAWNLPEEQKKDFWYRLGKITALDVYATSAAIGIWTVISRASAKNKMKHMAETPTLEVIAQDRDFAAAKIENLSEEKAPRAARMEPRAKEGFASMVAQPETQQAGVGI